nr:beta-glucosidase 11-like isoform X1 [Tanacetum cinerariifolium]
MIDTGLKAFRLSISWSRLIPRNYDNNVGFINACGGVVVDDEYRLLEDGRTLSIWDTYAHLGYYNGANGDIACDGYHKFSISWSRLIPNGRGSINVKGLQYYNDFINELSRHGIQPHVTLHHDDLPQILEDEYEGWISKNAVKDFVAYADVCFREFSDRVKHCTTFNEVNVFTLGGYDLGFTPPGRCSFPFGIINCTRGDSTSEPYIAAHNLLLAHASAVKLYREKYK